MNRLAGLPDPRKAPAAAWQASARTPSPKAVRKLGTVASTFTRGPFSMWLRVAQRTRASSGPITFWAALDETARQDFLARADRQTFPAGAKIMQQGELADHVAVILAGRVRVYVRDSERERVLALRETGELVGERAALRIGVRSATVLALEKVRA